MSLIRKHVAVLQAWACLDLVDLVISDEPHMVSELTDLSKFPGSDHKALTWKLGVYKVCRSTKLLKGSSMTSEKPTSTALEKNYSQSTV